MIENLVMVWADTLGRSSLASFRSRNAHLFYVHKSVVALRAEHCLTVASPGDNGHKALYGDCKTTTLAGFDSPAVRALPLPLPLSLVRHYEVAEMRTARSSSAPETAAGTAPLELGVGAGVGVLAVGPAAWGGAPLPNSGS